MEHNLNITKIDNNLYSYTNNIYTCIIGDYINLQYIEDIMIFGIIYYIYILYIIYIYNLYI